jgi:hypothetical protein
MYNKIKIFMLVCTILLLSIADIPPVISQDEDLISESVSIETDIEFFVLELPNSIEGGFEPHILFGPGIDGNEWLYIDSPTGLGSGLSGNLWISKDGGYTWEFKETGRPPNNMGGSGDSYCAVFSDGTIVFTDLYLITVTVDTSLDGGETWLQNPQASVTPLDDRQWLQIGPTVSGGPASDPETLYLVYNQIPFGLYIQKSRITATGYGWIPGNAGLPVSTQTGSRDYFVVDQNDGTLYLPNKEGGNLVVYVSTDGANTFTSHTVLQGTGDIQNIFTAVDVDIEGNIYLIWAQDKADIFMAVSTDKGQTWDISQVTKTPGCRVLPWITAGDAGRIGLTWYETDKEGDSDNTDDMENATWDVKAAFCVDALSENRTFLITTMEENVHTGTIKTTGASSSEADRDLGDFFTCDVDSMGRLVVTYGKDGDDGPNQYQAVVMFAKQMEGPFLLENMGPVANFTYETDGLTVEVDASQSVDLNGNGIDQYIWDWGDGTNGTGKTASHTYNRSGEYFITLKVVNKDGLISKITKTVNVSEIEEEFNPVWILLVIVLLLVVATIAYFVSKKQVRFKPTEKETVVTPIETNLPSKPIEAEEAA